MNEAYTIEPYQYLHAWLHVVPQLFSMRDTAYRIYQGVCPPEELCLRAFEYFYPKDTKVVILGQDPYHTPGKANGLAFGYHKEYKGTIDASMRNIIKELQFCGYIQYEADEKHGAQPLFDYSLESWAKQGVLLLNTSLTVIEGHPMSHAKIGWDKVIQEVLKYLLENAEDVTYLLWGKEALQTYVKALKSSDPVSHQVVPSSHPSPLSAMRGNHPFLGSGCFKKAANINWGGY